MKKILLFLALAITLLYSCSLENPEESGLPEGFEKYAISKDDATEEAYGIVWMDLYPEETDPVYRALNGGGCNGYWEVIDDKGNNLLIDEEFVSRSYYIFVGTQNERQFAIMPLGPDFKYIPVNVGIGKQQSYETLYHWGDGSEDVFKSEPVLSQDKTKWGVRFYLNGERLKSIAARACENQVLVKKSVSE